MSGHGCSRKYAISWKSCRQRTKNQEQRSRHFFERASKGAYDAAGAKRIRSSRGEEAAAATVLIPRVQSLQRYLIDTSSDNDPEAHHLLQKALNTAIGYIAGYQNVRDQLILLDAQREATAQEIRSTRPMDRKVDHAELTQEIISRFPKNPDRTCQMSPIGCR